MTVQINGDTGVSLVQDNTIQTADIVNGAVTADKLASGSTGTAAPQKMMLMAAKATTSGTAIDFSPTDGTGIPSWAKRVTVMFNGVSGSGTSVIQVQLGAGAVETTGYAGYAFRFTGATLAGTTGNTSGAPCQTATAGVDRINGAMKFILMGSNVWAFESLFDTSDGGFAQGSVGKKTLSGTLDRIRITTVNGTDTFDAGSVSLLIEG